jgi:hypothetical protein
VQHVRNGVEQVIEALANVKEKVVKLQEFKSRL